MWIKVSKKQSTLDAERMKGRIKGRQDVLSLHAIWNTLLDDRYAEKRLAIWSHFIKLRTSFARWGVNAKSQSDPPTIVLYEWSSSLIISISRIRTFVFNLRLLSVIYVITYWNSYCWADEIDWSIGLCTVITCVTQWPLFSKRGHSVKAAV